jgi:ATP-dependent exoDNAse (exonuclease V) alpha subunit
MAFGGLNVILLGDFFQLPPVGSLALYNTGMLKSELDIAGRVAYHQFNRTIELDEIVRQQGAGEAPFRQALEGLRHNTVTRNDWDLLTTRVAAQLTDTEVHAFDDAIRIFGRKIDVNEYNQDKMAALNVPVIQLEALHEGHQASDASFDDASNLHKTLPICIGARIMLTENLWTERGLVNGALGTVIDLTWSEGATIKKDLPLAVLIAFDKYEDDGPCLYRTDAGCPVVPIFTSRREFFRGAAQCHRTQFPLTVAFAVTVHKAQGMTVDQAVLNIARKDFVVGLTYVAVSRVKSLSGILFESPFDFIRFKGIPTHTETMRLADKARRLSEVVAL